MRKLMVTSSLVVAMVVGSGQAWAFFDWPGYGYRTDAPYWPEYRAVAIPEAGCVRWNWQQLSYYDYCRDWARFAPRDRRALRVRG